jgi:hypothetical protein
MPHRESPAVEEQRLEAEPEGESWPASSYEFKPLKHNPLVAGLALQLLKFRTRRLERVIFTATTGRSGTLTLSRLFSAVRGCIGDAALVDRVYRQIKAVNIRRAAAGYRYYLEANHLFVKTFIQNAVVDFGARLAVVHLVRPAVEVATSIYCLGNFPGTERGNFWWLDYRAPSNIISMAELLERDPEFSHPFYKGLWYWHEIEARIAAWRAAKPSLKVVRFETHWFNDLQKVCELLDSLGIQYQGPAIEGMIGTREHTKADQKPDAPLPAPVAEQMALRFLEVLRQRGLAGYC